MRLRRLVRSRSHDLAEFRREWVESGLPQHPTNRWLKDYLLRLKESSRWLPVRSVVARAGFVSRLTTWVRWMIGMLSAVTVRRPTPSTSRSGRTGPAGPTSAGTAKALAVSLAASTILLSGCASGGSTGPCNILPCGVECCNNDGKLCEGCDGRGVSELREDSDGDLP
jgi:hypothetical protein